MSWPYHTFLRPALFAQDPEAVHQFTLRWLGGMARHRLVCRAVRLFFAAPPLPISVFGLSFPNPVGLAAGMDKEAAAVPIWAALGFGHCELGAVTWHAQPGNPKPRLFRVIPDQAILNRMGFNNHGALAFAERLAGWQRSGHWPAHPVGINLGKSKIAPLDKAAEDYAATFRLLWPHADFFVVNVSSPNTPNLRQLQDKPALDEILAALQEVNRASSLAHASGVRGQEAGVRRQESGGRNQESGVGNQESGVRSQRSDNRQSAIGNRQSVNPQPSTPATGKPILVKIAPDLSFCALDEILELVAPRQIAGLIATNTTVSRPETSDPQSQRLYAETGGLSGRPLRARSTEVVRHLYRQTRGSLPIVGVGGVFEAADAWEKITAGASLLQVYTGLVYEGPSVARRLVRGLRRRLAAAGLCDLKQAVGMAVKT
jgi:dihydroorotate dehydrogenase